MTTPVEKLAGSVWTILLSRMVVICMPILFGGFIWFCVDAYQTMKDAQLDMKREIKEEIVALRGDINSANTQALNLLQGIAEQRADIRILYNTTALQTQQIHDLAARRR